MKRPLMALIRTQGDFVSRWIRSNDALGSVIVYNFFIILNHLKVIDDDWS